MQYAKRDFSVTLLIFYSDNRGPKNLIYFTSQDELAEPDLDLRGRAAMELAALAAHEVEPLGVADGLVEPAVLEPLALPHATRTSSMLRVGAFAAYLLDSLLSGARYVPAP